MKLILLAFAAAVCQAQTPDVSEIMARVAENQSRAMEQRKDWVYHQKQLLRMQRGNGKMAREERREYMVTPDLEKIKKELTRFEGKYERNGKYIAYDKPGYTYKEMDIDGELIDEMSNEMTNDNSRDGVGADLFPLTAKEQAKYTFRLIGTQDYRGRAVYRIGFAPKNRHWENNSMWKGEALIDTQEYQPVTISTNLASRIPMAVQILFGTNIKGLGFSVAYQKFDDGVWFPVSYGGEFQVRAVFFYKRSISISMVNADFRRTSVSSNVAYATDEK